jgi:type I restriction enzyme S subunit
MASGVALAERVEELPKAEGPWPVPEGWCWATLGEVLNPISTTDPKRALGQRTFHYIDLSALVDGRVTKAQLIPGNEAPSRARQVVKAGDTLFSCVRVYLQNIALLGDGLSSPVASTAYCVMRPSAVVDPRYLNYFVRSRRFIEWMIPLQRGNSPPAVLDGDLKAQAFPLAPLAEQRRIVARVDALFDEIAEGEVALAEARKGLDIFRRALLKAAVTGELTKDWRAANPVAETGHELLARIAEDRANKAGAKGRTRRAANAESFDSSNLPELQIGWAWARLSSLGEFGRGKSRHRPRDDVRLYGGNMPFVQTGVVANSDDYIRTFQQTYSAFGIEQSRVWPPGTLCITIAANIAKTAITTFDCCFPDSIVGLSPLSQIDPYWVHIWIKTIQQRLERFAPATAQKNINLEVLDAVMVPIPPPTEATEILRRVSAALAASADTLAMLDAEAADAARLKQSVLKAAFEGRLVPQDLADEPASALLARLARNPSATRARRGRATSWL